MTKYMLVTVLMISIILISCNEKEIIKKTESETAALSAKDSGQTKKEKEYLEKQKQMESRPVNFDNNLKPEELSIFFPKSISGYENLPISSGTMSDEKNELITYAKAQFDNDNGSIILDIMDYSKHAVIPNIEDYDNPPKITDIESEKFVLDDAKGFILWDIKNKFGRLEVLLKNRFIVVVRFNNPGNDKKILKNIFKQIKINELVKS